MTGIWILGTDVQIFVKSNQDGPASMNLQFVLKFLFVEIIYISLQLKNVTTVIRKIQMDAHLFVQLSQTHIVLRR